MIIFRYLTYRNIHLTRLLARQFADRQIVRIILIQIILVIISNTLYSALIIYTPSPFS
jgi:hypothetical protein